MTTKLPKIERPEVLARLVFERMQEEFPWEAAFEAAKLIEAARAAKEPTDGD